MQGSNWMFVGAAYAVSWIVIVGYAVHLAGATRRARRALAQAEGTSIMGAPRR